MSETTPEEVQQTEATDEPTAAEAVEGNTTAVEAEADATEGTQDS